MIGRGNYASPLFMENNQSMFEAAANLNKNPVNLPNDLKKLLNQLSEEETACAECYATAPDWTRLTPNMPSILKENSQINGAQINEKQFETIPEMQKQTQNNMTKSPESNNGFWRYNEDKILKQLEEYLKSTYSQHYVDRTGGGTEQTIDKIKHNRREGFCAGNVSKYIDRYDTKGTPRADLFKVLHYTMLLINHLNLIENK